MKTKNRSDKKEVNLETDNMAGSSASRRQEDKLEDHEERIVIMEKGLRIRAV